MSKKFTLMSDLPSHEIADRLQAFHAQYKAQGVNWDVVAHVSQTADDDRYIFTLRLQTLARNASTPTSDVILYGSIFPQGNRTLVEAETEDDASPKTGASAALSIVGFFSLCIAVLGGFASILVSMSAFMAGGIAVAQSHYNRVTYLQDVLRVCAGRDPVYHPARFA